MRRFLRLSHHSANGDYGDANGAQTVGDHRHGSVAGGERSSLHQHVIRRSGSRKACHDIVVEPRHIAHVRGHIVSGERRTPVRHSRRNARRSGVGNDTTVTKRLFSGGQGGRSRRLQAHSAGSGVGAGDVRLRGDGFRIGIQIQNPGCDTLRRSYRPDDGKGDPTRSQTPHDRRLHSRTLRRLGPHRTQRRTP